MRMLIAEDDRSVCEMLSIFFKEEHYEATFVHDGNSALQLFRDLEWDFLILDWMLPGKDGITICKEIRKTSETPIILLTAKDTESDRIYGLEIGADDYVTKPFSPMELIARIKAVLRRTNKTFPTKEQAVGVHSTLDRNERIQYKDISIHIPTREVLIGEVVIHNLTPKEFDLLSLFVKHPKRVFSREQLLESIWGFDFFGEERTVDVHIKRLRNKITSPQRQLITTVWGVGYKLEE